MPLHLPLHHHLYLYLHWPQCLDLSRTHSLVFVLVCAHAESRQRVACHRNTISISIWLLSLRRVAQCLRKLAKIYFINCQSRFSAVWQSMPRSRHRVRQANDGAPVQARRGNLSELRLLQSNRAKSKVHENRINSYKCCRPKVETPHRVALIYGQLNEVLDCRWPKYLAAFSNGISNMEFISGIRKWKVGK